MKKSFLLLAAIAFASVASFAQTTSTVTASPVSFGVKAGINLANLSAKSTGSDFENLKSKIGLNAGVFATFHVSESFGIQPELAWSTLGAKAKEGDTKLAFNYLTLPVLAKYTFTGSGFSLLAGPQIGYLLSAKAKGDGADQDIKDFLKSTDFAGVAGLEFQIPNTKFNIAGRYQFGLSNILDADGDGKLKNNAATFTVGYRFN